MSKIKKVFMYCRVGNEEQLIEKSIRKQNSDRKENTDRRDV